MCVWETAVVICSRLSVPLLHTWHRSHAWGSSRQCYDKNLDCWLNTAMHSGSLKALECESSSDLLQPTSLANRQNTQGQLRASLPPPDSLNFHFTTNLSLHSSDDNQRTKLRLSCLFKKTNQSPAVSESPFGCRVVLYFWLMLFSISSSGRGPRPLLQPATRGQSRCFAFGELLFHSSQYALNAVWASKSTLKSKSERQEGPSEKFVKTGHTALWVKQPCHFKCRIWMSPTIKSHFFKKITECCNFLYFSFLSK